MDAPIGPILFARGSDGREVFLAALLALPADRAPPRLEREAAAPVSATALAQLDVGEPEPWRLWRYDFTLPVRPEGAGYALGLRDWHVATDIHGDLRIAYTSCNGHEREDVTRPDAGRNAMWQRLAGEHARDPLLLLLQGGDQLYADGVWHCHPELERWHEQPRDIRLARRLSSEAMQAVRRFYAASYLHLWSQPELAPLLAQVPSLMMWDDHDIFDGWGSHAEELQQAPAWRQVFQVARGSFAMFQLAAWAGPLPPICGDASGHSLSWLCRYGELAILAPDLRSERTRHRVMGDYGWAQLEGALERVADCRQVLVMSSVPALGPRLSVVERLMLAFPGAQRYEDDLRDQWQSRVHRAEWQRFLRRLEDLARDGPQVTLLSGEIHLATRAEMNGAGGTLHQLVASGIAHPAPPRAYALALGALASLGESPLPGRRIRLCPLPGRRTIYTAERNALLLERRNGRWSAWWDTEHGGPTPALDLA